MLDRVLQGEDDGEPADEQAKAGCLESGISCVRFGDESGLIGVALFRHPAPASGNDHEEVLRRVSKMGIQGLGLEQSDTYQPQPKVEPQRQVELDLRPAVVISQDEWIGIDILPVQPRTPMTNGLPDHRDCAPAKQVVEEDRDDERQFLDAVSVDIDIDEEADESGAANPCAPVPLPSTTDWVEP